MEKNGRISCTGNSRHIHVRYFVIKDKIDKKEVRVEYFPTSLMIANYFIKPLNSKRFKVLQEFIMGLRVMSSIKGIKFDESDSKIKERVENQ